MPSQSCVIEYQGARGVTYYVKFLDAHGRQIKEKVGRKADGYTRRDAEDALRERLVDVRREGLAVSRGTFGAFVEEWRERWLPSRRLKPTTLSDYGSIIDRHLVPFFGEMPLSRIDVERVDAYIAAKTTTLASKTLQNHVRLLGMVLRTAKKWRRIRENPLEYIDALRVRQAEMVILSEDEVALLLAAYNELEVRHPGRAAWWAMTRRMVVVTLGTAIRRGELLGVRWGDVDLLNRRLEVRQAWVRGAFTTPKSTAGRRSIGFGLKTAAALEEQYRVSAYKSDDALVFGHPQLGTPLDPTKLTRDYVKVALRTAGITKPLQPWHGLRHTALTFYATTDGVAPPLVQARAGHSQYATTQRYIHASQVEAVGVEQAEERLLGSDEVPTSVPN